MVAQYINTTRLRRISVMTEKLGRETLAWWRERFPHESLKLVRADTSSIEVPWEDNVRQVHPVQKPMRGSRITMTDVWYHAKTRFDAAKT